MASDDFVAPNLDSDQESTHSAKPPCPVAQKKTVNVGTGTCLQYLIVMFWGQFSNPSAKNMLVQIVPDAHIHRQNCTQL